jgi:hypothetical protein
MPATVEELAEKLCEAYKSVPAPGVLEKIGFAYWIQAECGNANKRKSVDAAAHEAGLKNRGFFPLDNGWPELRHWWPGPINIGDHFIWAPTKPESCALVEVKRIVGQAPEDRIIWSICLAYSSRYRWPHKDPRLGTSETYNDES